MTESNKGTGFDTIALHGGYDPDPSVQYGLGQVSVVWSCCPRCSIDGAAQASTVSALSSVMAGCSYPLMHSLNLPMPQKKT